MLVIIFRSTCNDDNHYNCFGYRYMPIYFAQMTELSVKYPMLYKHFVEGGFSVQRGQHNPFGRIAVDQTTEETVNRDTQTAGGTSGFSLKPGAVLRYYLTSEYRAEALKQLRQLTSCSSSRLGHADLGTRRICKMSTMFHQLLNFLKLTGPIHLQMTHVIWSKYPQELLLMRTLQMTCFQHMTKVRLHTSYVKTED